PLPVEMAGFDAVQDGSSVELTWRTASETNNAGFDVQHQPSGSKEWRKLGFVESKASGGTTTEPKSYRFTAENLSVGTHRFRLRQVDLDGSTSLSEPVTVELRMEKALRLSPPMPNPVRTSARLRFGVRSPRDASIRLYNVLGQRVATLYTGTPAAGEMHTLRVGTQTLGQLPSGVYFVRLTAGGKTRTRRLTIAR
ncbi:MAG: T9SS type A sorting domain-containing protein, partial [Salinibacter sp.]